MRSLLLSCIFALLGTITGAEELQPGDRGYKHSEMHLYYQELFSGGKCNCQKGECRPTLYRLNANSPSGVQVILNRQWVDVPYEAIQPRQSVPPELWVDMAHICAFVVNGRLVVECAIINAGL